MKRAQPAATKHANGHTNGSPLLRWHRRIGIALAVIFLGVGVTGLVLNHSEDLGLYTKKLQAAWLYRWYGMQPRTEPVAFRLDQHWAVWLEGSLYLDGKAVCRMDELRGAALLDAAVVAAGANELVLFKPDGDIIERLNQASLPPGEIAGIGLIEGSRLAVQTGRGLYAFDSSFLKWEKLADATAVSWIDAAPLPENLKADLFRSHRGDGLSLHRVMLDIHSGRFFGKAGVYVVDFAALALLFLTLSGACYALFVRSK